MRPLAQRSSLGRGWRLGFACCALSMGAACTDGYPTEDALILSPFNMTQTQRLVAMNAIGDDAHAQRSWNYTLLPGCVLRIDVDGEQGSHPAFKVALIGSVIEIEKDRTDNTFNVAVAKQGDNTQAAASVLESDNWVLASRAHLLLRVLQRGCTDAVGKTVSQRAVFPWQSAP
ncbi:MAG: hypothetical protein Q7U05_15025 [Polaromonas sp.]|nr:hypothetical protein [Polaromonas sp.]